MQSFCCLFSCVQCQFFCLWIKPTDVLLWLMFLQSFSYYGNQVSMYVYTHTHTLIHSSCFYIPCVSATHVDMYGRNYIWVIMWRWSLYLPDPYTGWDMDILVWTWAQETVNWMASPRITMPTKISTERGTAISQWSLWLMSMKTVVSHVLSLLKIQ